jgi:hypothetical protein
MRVRGRAMRTSMLVNLDISKHVMRRINAPIHQPNFGRTGASPGAGGHSHAAARP